MKEKAWIVDSFTFFHNIYIYIYIYIYIIFIVINIAYIEFLFCFSYLSHNINFCSFSINMLSYISKLRNYDFLL